MFWIFTASECIQNVCSVSPCFCAQSLRLFSPCFCICMTVVHRFAGDCSDAYRWLGVRHRTRNLCRVFGLPNPKEDLLSEFHAALRKRVLLQVRSCPESASCAPERQTCRCTSVTEAVPTHVCQGRVYVFANYICFTSNPFFGYIKKTVIPFQVKSWRAERLCRLLCTWV